MTTNFEKLQAVLAENDQLYKDYIRLSNEATAALNKLQKAIGDVSVTFTEEDDQHDELVDAIWELASNFGMEWNATYGVYDVGERIEFWEPSTC